MWLVGLPFLRCVLGSQMLQLGQVGPRLGKCVQGAMWASPPLLQLRRFGWVTQILAKSRDTLHVEKTNINRGPRANGNRAEAKDFPLGSFGSSGL